LQTMASTEGNPAGCYDFQINQSLYQRSGQWKLGIDGLITFIGVGFGVGDDGTTTDYRYDGSPELLAQIRAKLELQLKPYGIELRTSSVYRRARSTL